MTVGFTPAAPVGVPLRVRVRKSRKAQNMGEGKRSWYAGNQGPAHDDPEPRVQTVTPLWMAVSCPWRLPLLTPPLLSTTEELEHSFWNPKDTGPQPSLATVSYAVLGSLCNLSKLQGIQL